MVVRGTGFDHEGAWVARITRASPATRKEDGKAVDTPATYVYRKLRNRHHAADRTLAVSYANQVVAISPAEATLIVPDDLPGACYIDFQFKPVDDRAPASGARDTRFRVWHFDPKDAATTPAITSFAFDGAIVTLRGVHLRLRSTVRLRWRSYSERCYCAVCCGAPCTHDAPPTVEEMIVPALHVHDSQQLRFALPRKVRLPVVTMEITVRGADGTTTAAYQTTIA